MSKRFLYVICAFFGAVAVVGAAESDWLLAALMGAGLGITVALVVHAYPNDIAPPADRRHEATQRRKAAKASARS
ncbi:MAG: hypothetical protein JO348_13555 [Alphaproteobacteria bacterium]|nr:hypothetical protein [Alphaproteobacteria bacterium]MBV9420794.1 hypothetical protein [Alphaproteobacteria bacterium]MBV9542667.1 hypothetical protein [Alphaproteobacteria bacterium]MBV9905600.1 hypothetical protein [Alphaproteobacteria bacterium]